MVHFLIGSDVVDLLDNLRNVADIHNLIQYISSIWITSPFYHLVNVNVAGVWWLWEVPVELTGAEVCQEVPGGELDLLHTEEGALEAQRCQETSLN